jgi:hypothetical protein
VPEAFTMSPQDQALLERVLNLLAIWEPYHERWLRRANHFYGLYRNYQSWKKKGSEARAARDLDARHDNWADGQTEWGPELFIPRAFSTVETIIPAMLAQPPAMNNIRAMNQASESNVENVRAMVEAQQEAMEGGQGYELVLQRIAKDGLIYGLGVQKTYWKREFKKIRRNVPSTEPAGGMVGVDVLDQVYDDPDCISIDPKDFIPDPFGESITNCDGAFHRAWRSNRYVARKIESGEWRNLTGSDLSGLADSSKYDSIVTERERAIPQPAREGKSSVGKQPIHEVLEFHDGENVVTVLDRKVVVASGPNPNWHGELPFQTYRPTEIPHEIRGMGEIEPIEKLVEEMNSLRTERRYNAALVLQKVFAYHEGMVEEGDIAFGPGYLIGVNGDPRELLYPIQVGDIPNSGYEEEDRVSNDIDGTSGISDTIMGTGAGGETATGVQLVQNAASRRIENKTLRLELEVINPGAAQIISLDQQRILTDREVAIPTKPTPLEPDRRFTWVQLGPMELLGEFEIRAGRRSTMPQNIPQERADAQMAGTLFAANQSVDQRKLAEFTLGKLGIEHPETFLTEPQATVPAATLDVLAQRGVDPQLLSQALAEAGGPDLAGGNEASMRPGAPVAPEGPPEPQAESPPGPESGGEDGEPEPEPVGQPGGAG